MMKQRAGLGKKVSSIFDGVPLPNITQEPEQASKHAEPQLPPIQRETDIVSPPRQAASVPQTPVRPTPAAAPQPQGTTPVQRPQPVSTEKPIQRVNSISVRKESISSGTWRQLIHKFFFSGDKELDARNRRAITMSGVLFVLLITVLWWTGIFSGSSSNRSTSAVASAANNDVYINWTIPQALPANHTRSDDARFKAGRRQFR